MWKLKYWDGNTWGPEHVKVISLGVDSLSKEGLREAATKVLAKMTSRNWTRANTFTLQYQPEGLTAQDTAQNFTTALETLLKQPI